MLHCCNALRTGKTCRDDVEEVAVQSACYHCAQVFAGAMSAVVVMTVLSAAMGWAAPNLVSTLQSRVQTRICSSLVRHFEAVV